MTNLKSSTQTQPPSSKSRDLIAIITGIIAFIIWIFVLHYKYRNFGYYDWDLAFFSQAMWNLLHGSQYVSLVGINFFGDHSYFIMILLLPLFAIFPHPLTLVFLKIFIYVLASFILYRIVKKALGQPWATLTQLLYLVFPANVFSLLYEFNSESLAPVFLFLMYHYFQKGNIRLFLLNSLVAILIKENMLLVTLAFGVYALADKRKNKLQWGIVPIVDSILLLYLLAVIIIPYFRELPSHAFVVRYRQFGDSLGEIFWTIISNPVKTLSFLSGPVNIVFLLDLFGPLLPLSLLSPHIIALIFPILLQHLLSIHIPERSIYYHYGVVIVPFIFLAALNTLTRLRAKAKPQFYRGFLILIFCLCFAFSLSYTKQFLFRMNYHKDNLTEVRKSFLKEIPKEAGVIATFDFLAELSLRKSLYSFHKVYNDYYQDPEFMKYSELNVRRAFTVPHDASYALIDFNDHWLREELQFNADNVIPRIEKFFTEHNWVVKKAEAGIVLYVREDRIKGK